MNYLAHLVLSGSSPPIIMGNYVGDYVKGALDKVKLTNQPESFLLGLRLHRMIDSFTDTHESARTVRRIIAKSHGKIAPIAVDIFFDHFLALRFEEIYGESLENFQNKILVLIEGHFEWIPYAMQPLANAMLRHRWLTSYASIQGVRQALSGLSRRHQMLAQLEGAEEVLMANFEAFDLAFLTFFPALKKASEEWLASNKT